MTSNEMVPAPRRRISVSKRPVGERLTIAWLFRTELAEVKAMLLRTRDEAPFSCVPFTKKMELQVERADGQQSQPMSIKVPAGDFGMRLVEDQQGEWVVELYEVNL